MAQRRRRRRRRAGWKRVVLIVVCAILAVSLGLGLRMVRSYMRQTHVGFFTAVRDTVRIGFRQLGNLTPGADSPVATSPYSSTDFYEEDGFIRCSSSEVSRVGIDVSSHQGQIDWAQVRDAGVEFAIIRVGYRGYTDGLLYEDTMYYQNIEGALAAGLDVGVYFFSQATSTFEAREEAQFVLDRLGGYEIRYPVFFDWEGIAPSEGGARTDEVDGEMMTRCAIAFCDSLEVQGFTAGVYFNQSYGYNSFSLRQMTDYEFWLAEYNDQQDFLYEVQLWQYSCEATLPGIETTVDLNLCYRDYLTEQPEEPEDTESSE